MNRPENEPVLDAIMAQCATQVKRLTLELGGKSPNIVFADADIMDAALLAAISPPLGIA